MLVFGRTVQDKDAIKGLMFVKKPLYSRQGMLFDMHPESTIHSMWMKNTYIPLDVIFLDENMKIIGYKENNQPHSLRKIKINKPSRYVLEMNGGNINKYNLKKGDKIYFINLKYVYFLIIIILILYVIYKCNLFSFMN